jgi:hypothetical protein
VTSHALPWMVCVIVEPALGCLNHTVGAASAANGATADSAQTASAIGVLCDFIETPLFLGMDYAAALQHEPCHQIDYKANQRLNYKT